MIFILLHLFFMSIGRAVGVATPMSADDKNTIVQCHNNLRSQLAMGNVANITGQKMPRATNMVKMQWDDAVGQTAQGWANQCQIEHSNAPDLGENLYFSSWPDFTNKEVLLKSCNAWWSELGQFGINKNIWLDYDNLPQVGHWTQMAWFNSLKIGCAVANCPNSEWKTYVVCNYSPAGNYLWMNTYEAGDTCSKCDSPSKCDNATGLCQ